LGVVELRFTKRPDVATAETVPVPRTLIVGIVPKLIVWLVSGKVTDTVAMAMFPDPPALVPLTPYVVVEVGDTVPDELVAPRLAFVQE
jgi:hypothetical protein